MDLAAPLRQQAGKRLEFKRHLSSLTWRDTHLVAVRMHLSPDLPHQLTSRLDTLANGRGRTTAEPVETLGRSTRTTRSRLGQARGAGAF